MHSNKFKEVLVILLSNALTDPHTMMIEFADTHIADTTMLTSRWLDDIARFTFIVFNIDDIVVVVFIVFNIFFHVF